MSSLEASGMKPRSKSKGSQRARSIARATAREGREKKINPNQNGGKELPQYINEKGNPFVLMRRDGCWKKEPVEVCYVVAMTFVPNPDKHQFVAHKDTNRLNNEATNLYWTPLEPTY